MQDKTDLPGGNESIARSVENHSKGVDLRSLVDMGSEAALSIIAGELSKVEGRIKNTQLSSKYSEIHVYIKTVESKEVLKEFRLYLLTELLNISELHISSISSKFDDIYSLDSNESVLVKRNMDSIKDVVLKKIDMLISMDSIGYSLVSNNDPAFQKIDIPASLQKSGKILPKEQTWKELFVLVEYVGLLVVQKEYEGFQVLMAQLKNTNLSALLGILHKK